MYDTVTLTGTYLLPDATPATGTIEIIPSERVIVDSVGDVILSGRVKVKLDETGSFSVSLPATDDLTLNPTGFGYTVAAKLHHAHLPAISFSLPAAVATVDIADVTTVDPSTFEPDANYISAAALAALQGEVDLAEADIATLETLTASGRLSAATLLATHAAFDGVPRTMADPGGGAVANFDYKNDGALPYIHHFRMGSNSEAGDFAIAIGTDRGAGGGVLVAVKNAAAGVQITNYKGSGIGAYIQGYALNPVIWAEVFTNSGGIRVDAKIGESFNDGVTTQGSTTLTSATANFTGADVGSAIVQQTSRDSADPSGSIPTGTTIASVTNSTTVVLSQAATFNAAGLIFRIATRAPAADQRLIEFIDTDGATALLRMRRNSFAVVVPSTLTTNDVASPGARVNGKSGQTGNIFEIHQDSASSAASVRVSSTGKLVTTRSGYLGNASLTSVEPLVVQNFGTGVRSMAIVGVASQTTDQLALLDSASAVQSRFNKAGYFITKKNAAPADADLIAGEMALWFDQTNGAAKLMVKAKEAGGTVRTATVALA